MKLYTILLLSFLLIIGQEALAEEYNNIAVSGTVQNPKSKSIRIVLDTYVPGERALSSEAELDGANAFHFVSYIGEPTFAKLIYGKESIPIYLEPGYDLHLSFEGGKLEQSLVFSGVGEQNNRFLLNRVGQFKMDNVLLRHKVRKSAEAEFVTWAKENREAQHALLQKEQTSLSSSFVSLQAADIDYSWANMLFEYARFVQENSKKQDLPEGFHDFLDEVKLHNYDVILLKSYQDFLENYLKYNYAAIKEELSQKSGDYYSNMYKVARRSLRSSPMYHMQAVYLVQALNYLGVDAVKDEYIEFANECPLQPYKNVLHQMVKEQTVSPKEPEVIFTDTNGRAIPLKELQGSIVLLRFTNYIHDSVLQSLAQQEQEIKNNLSDYQDVKFLELPMETNKEAFQKMVYADATEYLKSIMNRPKPGQEKPRQAPYTYVLLNRKGLVVSNSLDDPKNELALEKIGALLRQEERSGALE